MVDYTPAPAPTDTAAIPAYLTSEFNKIALALQHTSDNLEQTHVAPAKPRDGDLAYADGENWNPSWGKGVYIYRDSQWTPLQNAWDPIGSVTLWMQSSAPTTPQNGEVRYANGTDWNPGSGVGVYYYEGVSTTWKFLG